MFKLDVDKNHHSLNLVALTSPDAENIFTPIGKHPILIHDSSDFWNCVFLDIEKEGSGIR